MWEYQAEEINRKTPNFQLFCFQLILVKNAMPSRTILDTCTFYPRKTKVLPRLLKVKLAICQYQFTISAFILHKF